MKDQVSHILDCQVPSWAHEVKQRIQATKGQKTKGQKTGVNADITTKKVPQDS